jgi:hypothetical protein
MAGADDDFEKLMREVDGVLGSTGGTSDPRPAAASLPPARKEKAKDSAFLEAAVPRATAVGAAWGVGVGGAFFVLPFLHSISGAVAAFVTGFSMSILGRWRRR